MHFYTNVYQHFDDIYVREIRDGRRVQRIVEYQPSLFLTGAKDEEGFTTLDGRSVMRLKCDSVTEYKSQIELYSGIENVDVFGLDKHTYTFINEEFPGDTVNYDVSKIAVTTIDIETDSDGGFPNIEEADRAIITITLRQNNRSVVLGMFPFEPDTPDVKYIQCDSEKVLLSTFLEVWRSPAFLPDVVTGWNIDFFDMPYIINRIRRVLGAKHVKRLSPFEKMYTRRFELAGKEVTHELPVGITVLDYLPLYRKFSFSEQESFKLDHIAFIELGERKLDYRELGFDTLDEFYKKDFTNFVRYNIRDVDLVYKLEEKLKFVEQVFALAYDAKVNYIDTLTTVGMWDVIIHNYLYRQKKVVPRSVGLSTKDRKIEGAYVKDPQVGLHKWVVSFDLNSLYPHLMMQYNISPETLRKELDEYANGIDEQGIVVVNPSVELFLGDELEQHQGFLTSNDYTICPTGCVFDRSEQGFLPKLMETMYEDRSRWKKKMLEAKKAYEAEPSEQLRNEIARCHNMQLAKKIQLNSAYGALSNAFFRWFDPRLAESITKSGQLSIRWMEMKMNTYLNKLLKTSGEDYVIACDTDSMYIRLDRLVTAVFPEGAPDEKVVNYLDKVCNQKFEPFIDKCYDELAERVNARAQKMKMKREAIANKGIWTSKKHYILNVYNLEGVSYKEPKLKMQGIEAVRSSTPSACRESIKKTLSIIMNRTEDDVIEYIANERARFVTLPFEEVAFPRGAREINKYFDKTRGYKKLSTAGVPIHVRAALVYNHNVKKMGLENKLPLINDGDKIKFAYMKMPNPFHENVFATPGILFRELGADKYIDYNQQFEKAYLEPIKTILDVIGWQTERHNTIESFFG